MTTKQWDEINISDLFDSMATGDWGQNPTLSSSVPVIRSTNFRGNGYLDLSDVVYRAVSKDRLQSRTINQGDILFEKSGGGPMQPAGRVAYSETDLSGTASNFIEIGKVKNKFDKKFTFYLLHHLYLSGLVLKYQQQTTGIINFKIKEYFKETVKVPSNKKEQSQIAEILSTIDRAIAQTEALIAKHQRIKTGLMQDLLTRGIDEHGQLRDESTHKFKSTPLGMIPVEWEVTTFGEKVTLQRGFDITKKQLTLGKVPIISSSGITAYHDKATSSGPGVITGRKGTLGKVYFIDGPYWSHDTTLWVKDFHGNYPHFVAYFMTNMKLEKLDSATANPTLNRNFVHPILVTFPPYSEQVKITEILELASKQLDAHSVNLEKLQRIKRGLMQDLLSGEVSVTPLMEG